MRKAAFSLLKIFNKEIAKQPASVQAQILERVIKKIMVYEDRIRLQIYGAETNIPMGKNHPNRGL